MLAAVVAAAAVAGIAAGIARELTASGGPLQSGSSAEAAPVWRSPCSVAEAVGMAVACLFAEAALGTQYIAAATAAAGILWVATQRGLSVAVADHRGPCQS
jgi:hypothetical protein